jgi:hypothetical protein
MNTNHFSSRTTRYKRPEDSIPGYQQMHWTRQLELLPLRDRKVWERNDQVDYDNRLDNWDDPEEGEQ